MPIDIQAGPRSPMDGDSWISGPRYINSTLFSRTSGHDEAGSGRHILRDKGRMGRGGKSPPLTVYSGKGSHRTATGGKAPALVVCDGLRSMSRMARVEGPMGRAGKLGNGYRCGGKKSYELHSFGLETCSEEKKD